MPLPGLVPGAELERSTLAHQALRERRVPRDRHGDSHEVLEVLVAKVKHGQRTSQSWKEVWWSYCDSHQDGVRDPGRHDATSLKTFLEEFAPRVDLGSSDAASSRDRPVFRDFGGGGRPGAALSGGGGVSALADRVKQMQRRHESYKERWAWYCDTFGSGLRDPARHTPQFLQQYIAMVEGGGQGSGGRAGYQYDPYGTAGTSSAWGGYPGYPACAFDFSGYGVPGGGYACAPMVYPGYGYGAFPMAMFGPPGGQAPEQHDSADDSDHSDKSDHSSSGSES